MNFFTKKETVSEKLGVSLATVNNWIKTQVIPSPDIHGYYSDEAYKNIIEIVRNSSTRLNTRANRTRQEKKEINYLGINDKSRKLLLNKLIEEFDNTYLTISEGVLALSFALLRSNGLINMNWKENNDSKMDIFLTAWINKVSDKDKVKKIYSEYDIKNLNDDIIGAFYQSIQSISQKSHFGSYFTPSELLKDIIIPLNKTVLDPCCGSGGILLNILSKTHDHSKIYARDIDEIALNICFINLVLFFNDKNMSANILKHDIIQANNSELFSQIEFEEQFDYIVTNPPWGSKFSKKEKDNLILLYPELNTTEIFSIALYNSFRVLKQNGNLFFFLPHSFLNVAIHRNIRKIIFNKNNKIYIKLLGNSFKGVLSENILIHINKSNNEKDVTIQNKIGKIYQLSYKNIIPPDYIVSATSNNNDTMILEKIFNTKHLTLQNNSIFALGIVTGNNNEYLLSEKTKNNEFVFRGKDIEKYRFLSPEYCIDFQPKQYQQIAPVEYYRQKKIAYRFISDKLVCVLDVNNSLLLNSANLFISMDYPMETIVSLFNSSIYTFIYRKKFHSKKVLKSHLQVLPLPLLSNEIHKYILNIYNEIIIKNNGTIDLYQNEIDKIICKAFLIDDTEYEYIKGAI